MKKILLASTAIVAMATVSSEAFAAEKIELGLSGFMRHYVGVANHDETAPGASMSLGQRSNTEIHFTGSTTLDNGLSVAVKVEREGDRNNGNTDQSFVTVSSDAMGAITLGGAPHAADDFAVGAPMVGPIGFTDGGDWANASTATGAGVNNTYGVAELGGNNLKLKYVSPSFSGVTVGISYDAAGNVNGQKGGAARAATDDSSSIAAMYEGEISGASVSADIARFHANGSDTNVGAGAFDVTNPALPVWVPGTATAGNDFTNDRIGLSVGMAGFTVGGSYNKYNATAANLDGKAWELGVSYETGPYAVSAAYMNSSADAGAVATTAKDVEWVLGASYDLGASVALVGNYFNSKGTATGATSNTISGLVAGIEVGF